MVQCAFVLQIGMMNSTQTGQPLWGLSGCSASYQPVKKNCPTLIFLYIFIAEYVNAIIYRFQLMCNSISHQERAYSCTMHKIRGEDNGPIVPHRSCQETPIVPKIGRIYQADWLLYRSPFQPLTDCCCCLVTSPLSSWESEIQGKRERTRTYLLVILLREKRHAHKLLTV